MKQKKTELINWNEYLFRCSSLSNITATGRGAEITAKQKEELAMLTSKIKLTEKQAQRRDELVAKMDRKPELSKGAKTYLQSLWKEETFQRPKDITNKFMLKGIEVEGETMHLVNEVLGWKYDFLTIEKMHLRKERLANDYISGEPDVISYDNNHIADIKSSWDVHTFPLFEDKVNADYYAQGQGYLWLTGLDNYELCYGVVDTPEKFINDKIRKTTWDMDYIDIPQEDEELIRRCMTFDDIEKRIRVRVFKFQRDDEYIKKIEQCVKMAREYLMELNEIITKRLKS